MNDLNKNNSELIRTLLIDIEELKNFKKKTLFALWVLSFVAAMLSTFGISIQMKLPELHDALKVIVDESKEEISKFRKDEVLAIKSYSEQETLKFSKDSEIILTEKINKLKQYKIESENRFERLEGRLVEISRKIDEKVGFNESVIISQPLLGNKLLSGGSHARATTTARGTEEVWQLNRISN